VHQLLDTFSEGAMGAAFVTWPFVIGLGSHHGDDQAGWLVISRLRKRSVCEARLACLQHPSEVLDVIEAGQDLVICDACVGNGEPGSIHRWTWESGQIVQLQNSESDKDLRHRNDDALALWRRSGSHDLSLFDVMELGYSLGIFPESIEIWTLEGEFWVPGTEPSIAIQSAAVSVADSIWERCHDA